MITAMHWMHETAWRRTILAGATLGGIAWGLFAAYTVGAPADQAHAHTGITSRLAQAAVTTVGCLLLASLLAALGQLSRPARARALPALGLTLAVAAVSGWAIIAAEVLQANAFGAW
ncbi:MULTISPECIES: hypothetical protein [unclassified Mycobacterium]|uniref:hypothetical protein n=1 Tax=unclassified Mycobacterium TaxID=2642494 RepID=UPI0012E867F7|nr:MULTISPECIES: hypothetical protein [unclassified Mycobacterium]